MKEKKAELQSRREFFKEAAKRALPIIGAMTLTSLPMYSHAMDTKGVPSICDTCSYACGGSCSSGCNGSCSRSCKTNCSMNCGGQTTTNPCGDCNNACYGGCKGGCRGQCSGNCYSSCSGKLR